MAMTVSLALASPAAIAMKTSFGMEYRATAFANQSDAFASSGSGSSDSDNGLANLIRLKANFLDENTGISVYSSVELAGDRWVGDNHHDGSSSPSYAGDNNSENVRLDLGYVQIPVGRAVFRVGRQISSFNHCFVSCDSRKDAILGFMRFSKRFYMFADYYRVKDTIPYQNIDNGDEFDVGYVGTFGGWHHGLLLTTYVNNYNSHHDAFNADAFETPRMLVLSSYVSGDLGPVKLTAGVNWLGNSSFTLRDGSGDDQGQVLTGDSAVSTYLRLVRDVGPWNLGLQFVGAWNGGFIASGFDTWASTINNNPTATNSPDSMYAMGGGFGLQDFDENLLIGRVGFNITPKFTVTGAVGNLTVDNGGKLAAASKDRESSMVYDLRLAYQASKSVRTWLAIGYLQRNRATGGLSGNSLTGQMGPGTFDDDVKTASLNLTVDF